MGGCIRTCGDVGEDLQVERGFHCHGELIGREGLENPARIRLGHGGIVATLVSGMVTRSRVDWVLEGVALAALLGALGLAGYYWPQIPERVVQLGYRYGRPLGMVGIVTAKNALWMLALIDVVAYSGMTLGSRGKGLIEIPLELERGSPQLRQMLFSMMIVMKTVLMLFAVYLMWALVNIGLRTGGGGFSGEFLTLFTLAVPLPLIFYTLKLRKYQR